MGRKVALSGRDQTALEDAIRDAWIDLGPTTSAVTVEARVQTDHPRLWDRWSDAVKEEARHRYIRSRRPRPKKRTVRDHLPAGVTRARPRSPLCFVGTKQRDDLQPNYSPTPPDHYGALMPHLFNRGRFSATDIEVRVGSDLRFGVNSLPAGERVDLLQGLGMDGIHRAADLLGGLVAMQFAKFETEAPTEFRHLVTVEYSYNGRPGRKLKGELLGNPKRAFYQFTPSGEPASPIY